MILSSKTEFFLAVLSGGLVGAAVVQIWGVWAVVLVVGIELKFLWIISSIERAL